MEQLVKHMIVPGTLFEELGFKYLGPYDGHDLERLIELFEEYKDYDGPLLLHVITKKGKGYSPAENKPIWSHGVTPFDIPSGEVKKSDKPSPPSYTAIFSETLIKLADKDPKIVAITAAMPEGTGLDKFAKAHPTRMFDVGIAEEHAVTFSGGMATQGMKPIAAIYSTFLQRAYDNIIHDVAIQRLPVVFAMDRAGLVGEDGETHMGLYDIAYMLAVPGMVVTAPKNAAEMLGLLRTGVAWDKGPFALRYPRDTAPDAPPAMKDVPAVPFGTWEQLRQGNDGVAIIAVGTMVGTSLAAATTLAAEGLDVTVVNARFLKPFDEVALTALLAGHRLFLVVEEGTVVNGFGAFLATEVARRDPHARVHAHGVPDRVIYAAPRARQLAQCGLDAAGIAERVRAMHRTEVLAG
jgi:1-deoxy-D-xylulose-5-phosphate synthase